MGCGNTSRRLQVIVSNDEYNLVAQLARRQNKTISALLRDAIRSTVVEEAVREERRQALRTLLSLDAPVADWLEMEKEMARGAAE